MAGEAGITRERKTEHVRGSGRQNMSVGEADRTCQRERQAEHVRGRGRKNMSVRETGRTCHWEIM